MTARSELLGLEVGGRLRFDGLDWQVTAVEAQLGRVLLHGSDGRDERRSIRWLMQHPDCRAVSVGRTVQSDGQQPSAWEDLTENQQAKARLRAAHLLEAETGYRSGDPRRAEPGEPRPAYDPDRTTLGQRRRAKVAELKALGREEAAALGLAQKPYLNRT